MGHYRHGEESGRKMRSLRHPTAAAVFVALALTVPAGATAAQKTARCLVPKVAGDTLTVATKRLKAAHCQVGKITRPKIAVDLVVASSVPKAGRREKRGAKIHLTLTAGKISYKTAVDPTFTQSSSNPLAVTYTFDADAVEIDNGQTVNLGINGDLPAGVLNFYSAVTTGGPEQLYCSLNVGGSTSSSDCPITYTQTGTYEVTTQYIPNSATAVTETDQETINPYTTTTSLTATPTACGTLVPPTVTYPPNPNLEFQENCYSLALASTAPASLVLSVTPPGTANESVSGVGMLVNPGTLAPGATCTLAVYWYQGSQQQAGLGGGYSPNCSMTVGWTNPAYVLAPDKDSYESVTTWTLTAAFSATPGWVGSSSTIDLSAP